MMIWVTFSLVAIAFLILLGACRHITIDDGATSGYIVLNTLFGYPAYGGRVFRTKQGAVKAANKIPELFPNMIEVRKLV